MSYCVDLLASVAALVGQMGLAVTAGPAGSGTGISVDVNAMGADLQQMVLVALLNPAAILVGFFIGRRADQVHKIVVGGFVAGFAGLAFVWLMDKLGLYIGNIASVGGVFALSFLVGMVWSYVGFKTRKVPETS